MKGVFVDDKVDEAQYADLLGNSENGKLEVQFLQPVSEISEFAEKLLNMKIDFAALDFRLDEVPIKEDASGRQLNKYRASALAQQIRDIVIERPDQDIPLILLSQEDLIETKFRPDSTAKDLFDLVVAKQELVESASRDVATRRIASLARAYLFSKEQIQRHKAISLTVALNLASQDAEPVLQAQSIRAIDNQRYAHQFIAKLKTLFLERPGLLLSEEHVMARLGVGLESKEAQLKALREVMANAGLGYSGLLSEGWPRLWWYRLDSWCSDVLEASVGSLPGSERVRRLNTKLGLTLAPAISKWTKSSDELFWVACASCDHPTELRHSVLSFDDGYLPFLEPARICWSCVQTGRYETRKLEIDDSDEVLASKLKNGKIQQVATEK